MIMDSECRIFQGSLSRTCLNTLKSSLPPTKTQLKEVSTETTRITETCLTSSSAPRHVFLVTLAQFNEAAVGYAISLTRDPRRKARGCLKRDVLIDP